MYRGGIRANLRRLLSVAKKIDVPFNGTKEQEERLKKALAELRVEHGGQGLMIASLQ